MKILLTGFSGIFSKHFLNKIIKFKKIKLHFIIRKKIKIKKINFIHLNLSKKKNEF